MVGNLTADNTAVDGYVTAFDCGVRPLPADLNTNAGDIRSNRLVTKADQAGEVCFYTNTATDLMVDVNGTASVSPFSNERLDSRGGGQAVSPVAANGVLA